MAADPLTDDRKCKDVGHVRVVVSTRPGGLEPAAIGARYVGNVSCRNDPAYTGWAVVLIMNQDTRSPHDGLQMLPALAETLPAMLTRAAVKATTVAGSVRIEHTVNGAWEVYRPLTPACATYLATAILTALGFAPAGELG
jgi:hypothetical protein